MVSAEPEKKRIYIDYTTDTCTASTRSTPGTPSGSRSWRSGSRYGRPTARGGWRAHVPHGRPRAGRGKTYLGAFPSALREDIDGDAPRETILGDDIAYFRRWAAPAGR
jgi:hypothetical protein